MARMRKVYLPKWMTWFGLGGLVPMWLWISYRVFFTETGRSDLGLAGWVVVTVVMAVFATILMLMGKRKLPAYLVEIDENGDDQRPGAGRDPE